jgi:hypothetical protein
MTEIEVARIERDEQSDLADLGLRLTETWLASDVATARLAGTSWPVRAITP